VEDAVVVEKLEADHDAGCEEFWDSIKNTSLLLIESAVFEQVVP